MPQNRRAVVYLLSLLAASPLALASADLTVTVTAIVPAEVAPGAHLSVAYTVTNNGSGTAGPTALKLFVARDDAGMAVESYLSPSIGVPSLCGGCSASGEVSRVLPLWTTLGTRYLVAETDAFDVVAESNETNNTSSRPFLVGCEPLERFALTSPEAGASLASGNTKVNLVWESVPGAVSYEVYLSTYNPPLRRTTVEATSFETEVTPGVRHYWTIEAKNSCGGTVAASGGIRWFELICVPPQAFDSISPADRHQFSPAPANVQLTWSPSAAATHYAVYVGTQNPPQTLAGTVSGTSYELSLPAGALRYWRVEAVNACGKTWSATRSFLVLGCSQVTAPTLLGPPDGAEFPFGTVAVELSWEPVPGAESYDVLIPHAQGESAYVNVATPNYTVRQFGRWNWWSVTARSCHNVATSAIRRFSVRLGAMFGTDIAIQQNRVPPGTNVTIGYLIQNLSEEDIPPSVLDFWLSSDQTIGPGDKFLVARPIRALGQWPAEYYDRGTTIAALPAGTPLGHYYVIARPDAENSVREMIEGQTVATPFEISNTPPDLPDLEAVTLTISSAAPSYTDEVTITGTVKNTGAVHTWPYSDGPVQILTIDGTVVDRGSVPWSVDESRTVTWKGRLDYGTHTIVLDADPNGKEMESDETNNRLTRRVTVGPPVRPYGVTVLIHGELLPRPSPPKWTLTMADAIRRRAGKGRVLIYDPETGTFAPCTDPVCGPADPNGHVTIIVGWATEPDQHLRGFSEAAADALYAALVGAEERERLAKPFHIIGHGRGAVVGSELAERLLVSGRPVAQVTALDPLDRGAPGIVADDDVNAVLSANGVMAWHGEVVYDTYYSAGSGCESTIDRDGRPVGGAANRDLSALGLGHHQVHTWYHGTIDPSAQSDGTGDACGAIDPAWYGTNPTDCMHLPRDLDGYGYVRPADPWYTCLRTDESLRSAVQYNPSSARAGIVNGDFARPGEGSLVPGWSLHGGGGTASVAGGVLVLDGSADERTHNRFFMPRHVTRMAFDLRVPASDSGAAGAVDTLEVILSDGTTTAVVHRENLDRTIAAWEPRVFSVAAFRGRVCTVTVALRRGGAGVEAVAHVDNLRMLPMKVPRGDFDGDGSSEVLWRHADGTVAMWDINGHTLIDGSAVAVLSDADWHILGFGDFNADGRDDIFLRHLRTGATMMCLMNGRTILAIRALPTVADARWQMQAIGDFNGDGRDELIWRHTESGLMSMWETNGLKLVDGRAFARVADLAWQIELAGAADGDPVDELVWRHTSGDRSRWDLDGRTLLGHSVFLRHVYFPRAAITSILALGYFTTSINAETMYHSPDALWRDDETGAVWLRKFWSPETLSAPTMGEEWVAERMGDFNGDGRAEMLWRHSGTGDVVLWEVVIKGSSKQFLASLLAKVPDPKWKIQPPAR